MGEYFGDFPVGGMVDKKFNTQAAAGGSITIATDGTLRIYKNNGTTERASLAGVTFTEDFDTFAGMHHINIDLADNTDVGFWSAGSEISVCRTGMTIDGQTVHAELFCFSIERAGGALAILKSAVFGLSALKDLVDAVDAAVTVIDNNVDAIKPKTDALPTDPADQSLIIAATDAIMTRLGAPVGADLSADIQTRLASASITLVSGKVVPVDVDGLPFDKVLEAVMAAVLGITVKPAANVVEFRKRDGTTAVLTITYGAADGERTSSVIV